MEVDFINPTLDQALKLAPVMREADRIEVARAGRSPEESIEHSLRFSDHVWMAVSGDDPVCLIGVGRSSILPSVGTPWFLTTDLMNEMWAKRALIKLSPVFVSDFLEEYDMLSNYVDAQYAKALKWLKWLGFEISDPVPIPPYKQLFCEIRMERSA